MALELKLPNRGAEVLAVVALVRIESHAFVNGLIAAQAHDIKRRLESNDISALRQELAVDLCASVSPRFASESIQVGPVIEVFLVPKFRRIVPNAQGQNEG
jgi:hypothetical protein